MPEKKARSASKSTTKKEKTAKAQNDGSFAIIATGGKQYKVSVGQGLKIEKIKGVFKEGDKITFEKVLLIDSGGEIALGNPRITGSKVTATIEKIGRSPKVLVMKYKQKSRYYKKNTHRQPFFQVRINSIS